MTSNVGSEWIQELAAGQREELEKRVMEALHARFKPEFLNRIDDIVIFDNLDTKQIKAIVDIQIDRLCRRLEAQRIFLTLTDRAKEFLARQGYDPLYGARPLKRAIQKHIENVLAMEILKGHFSEGSSILADVEEGKIVFRKE